MVSVAEIYGGIYGSRDPQRHEIIFDNFLTGVTLLDITEEVCRKFGEIRNHLRLRGDLIGDFDLLIASCALVNNLVLFSNNLKHFKRIDDLRIGTL